jgi:hypothetical protein
MVDKVRLSVDQETQALLQSVTDGLRDALSAQPEWAVEQQSEILRKLQSIVSMKPPWATTLQTDIQSATHAEVEGVLDLVIRHVKTTQGSTDYQLRGAVESLSRIEAILGSQKQATENILGIDQETQRLLKDVADDLGGLLSARPGWAGEHHREVIEKLQSISSEEPSWAMSLQAEMQSTTHADLEKALDRVRQYVEDTQKAVGDQLHGVVKKLSDIEATLDSQRQANESILLKLENMFEHLRRQQVLLQHLALPWWKRIFGGKAR